MAISDRLISLATVTFRMREHDRTDCRHRKAEGVGMTFLITTRASTGRQATELPHEPTHTPVLRDKAMVIDRRTHRLAGLGATRVAATVSESR